MENKTETGIVDDPVADTGGIQIATASCGWPTR
jgi:hypothetical protein